MLKKSGLLELHRGGETFDDLGGLDAMNPHADIVPDKAVP